MIEKICTVNYVLSGILVLIAVSLLTVFSLNSKVRDLEREKDILEGKLSIYNIADDEQALNRRREELLNEQNRLAFSIENAKNRKFQKEQQSRFLEQQRMLAEQQRTPANTAQQTNLTISINNQPIS